jgi:uncharacterized YccA/Bax inhibitor family protein
MAFMRGSPVLTDSKFDEQKREASGQGGGAGTGQGYDPGLPSMPQSTGYSVMTIGGTITAAAVLMVLLVGAAVYGWTTVTPAPPPVVVNGVVVQSFNATIPAWVFIPLFAAVILGLVTAFVPKAARITAPLYCLGYGIFIGAISAVYNNFQEGIVTQALFATLGIFVAMLFLYATRIIKVTNKFVMVVVAATMGIFLMYLLAWVASLFGAQASFLNTPSPLSILLSVGIIIIAALNLAIDFAFIEKASQHQVPKYMEWYGAWGMVVTLIWIYLEVLRLLALLNRR